MRMEHNENRMERCEVIDKPNLEGILFPPIKTIFREPCNSNPMALVPHGVNDIECRKISKLASTVDYGHWVI
jgi:hypothetical protein